MADLATAAFDRHGFEARADGFRLAVPYITADHWARALCLAPYRSSVLFLLPEPSRERIDDLVLDGRMGESTLDRLMHAMISGAAGRPWYQAQLLVHSAMGGDGRILGALLLRGVRAQDVSLAEFCCAVWALVTENASGTDLMKLEARLTVPPPGADPDGFDEIDDFDALAQRMRAMPGVRVG